MPILFLFVEVLDDMTYLVLDEVPWCLGLFIFEYLKVLVKEKVAHARVLGNKNYPLISTLVL